MTKELIRVEMICLLKTPPLEAKRMLMSRALARRSDGRSRKLMFVDVKKAHLNPVCEEDVCLELPGECHRPLGYCGKLVCWMYGIRGAAAAWEKCYADKLSSVGFKRGVSCGVVCYHKERDVSLEVHGDDFTFCGLEEDSKLVRSLMESWFEIK
eukprot:281481-Karenia_brevis.AAC.1